MNFRYVQWRQIKQKLSPFNSIFFHWSIAIFHQKFNNSHSLATFSLPMCGILEEMLLLLLLLLFIVIPANICLTILPLGKISLCTQCYINSEKKKISLPRAQKSKHKMLGKPGKGMSNRLAHHPILWRNH